VLIASLADSVHTANPQLTAMIITAAQDNHRVRGAQVDPVLGGVVVEREQHLGVVDGGSTS